MLPSVVFSPELEGTAEGCSPEGALVAASSL